MFGKINQLKKVYTDSTYHLNLFLATNLSRASGGSRRIVNVEETSNEYPWMVQTELWFQEWTVDTNGRKSLKLSVVIGCAGSIISHSPDV